MRRRLAVPGLVAFLAFSGVVAESMLVASNAAAPRGVPGSIQQAYRATLRKNNDATVVPTKTDKTYRGPKLELAANYVGRKAAEPTLGVTGDGDVYYAAAAFDGPAATARTEILKSEDDGKTWHKIHQVLPTGRPQDGWPPTTLDPYVFVDKDTDRVFSIDLYVGCSTLSWTDDGGETWQNNPRACGLPVNDHHTLMSGKPRPGDRTIGYPNVVYYCVNQVADVSCARSLDGGLNFLPSGAPAFTGVDVDPLGFCGGLHGHIVVDREGRLYLPKGHCGLPYLAVSEDGGLTWRKHRVSDISAADIHTAVAVDDAGNVYYSWWDDEEHLPYLAVSKDHGRTWGTPMMIAPPGVYEVNFPSIDAVGKGRVAISFPGTTVDDPADTTKPWNYYVITTTNALESKPLWVSATANKKSDPIHRGRCNGRCAGMFDFLDLVIARNGVIWAAATDTCTAFEKCNTKDGIRARDAQGMAVHQVGGPGMPRVPRR